MPYLRYRTTTILSAFILSVITITFSFQNLFNLSTLLLTDAMASNHTINSDTVLVNGQFYTLDEQNPWAQAVAIKDGTIVAIGSSKDIDANIGDKTIVINLDGKFALPAFVESHLHPLSNTYPHQSLFDAGVNVTIGSDFITSEPDLMTAIYRGMKRSTVGGERTTPASQ